MPPTQAYLRDQNTTEVHHACTPTSRTTQADCQQALGRSQSAVHCLPKNIRQPSVLSLNNPIARNLVLEILKAACSDHRHLLQGVYGPERSWQDLPGITLICTPNYVTRTSLRRSSSLQTFRDRCQSASIVTRIARNPSSSLGRQQGRQSDANDTCV